MGRGGEFQRRNKELLSLALLDDVDSESSYGPSPQIFSSESSTTMLEASFDSEITTTGLKHLHFFFLASH